MDLSHYRKRKAESSQAEPESKPMTTPTLRLDVGVTLAPRQAAMAEPASGMWSSPSSPHPLSSEVVLGLPSPPAKRARVELTETRSPTLGPKRYMRRNSAPNTKAGIPSRPPPIARLGNDVEDLGIVTAGHPGPASGSLIRAAPDVPFTTKPLEPPLSPNATIPLIPIDPNSLHIPNSQPLINRHTLKELQLDSILRNPQLRHDILFDSGLQFRPTNGRRKREVSEKYWNAITLELEAGCTCVSFDMQGQPQAVFCACHHVPMPAQHPVMAYCPPFSVVTLRMPSRIRTLLTEFLHVLLLVVQPLASINPETYINPDNLNSQLLEQSTQAALIQSIFDPALIEQELKHGVFDPSGLFRSIGSILKAHCAPMRDQAVDSMVQLAETCAPGGSGTTGDAVKAVSMCLDILEQMKLDIANHQLTTLRPFLIRTAGQFELKAFKNGRTPNNSLRVTREWLRTAHAAMISRDLVVRHPRFGVTGLRFCEQSRNQQVYLAAVSAITDLVFYPPPTTDEHPETAYLDNQRLQLLSTDTAEITATHLLLLLYRQLVSSSSSPASSSPAHRITDTELISLKNEVRDIAPRLGYYFFNRSDKPKTQTRFATIKQDLILQVARRSEQARTSGLHPTLAASSASVPAPSERVLGIAARWADANLHLSSPLATLLRRRLRDVVFNTVTAMTFPGHSTSANSTLSLSTAADVFDSSLAGEIKLGVDMEPLASDIKTLCSRVARLVLVHLNAYLPLYEHERFLEEPPSSARSEAH